MEQFDFNKIAVNCQTYDNFIKVTTKLYGEGVSSCFYNAAYKKWNEYTCYGINEKGVLTIMSIYACVEMGYKVITANYFFENYKDFDKNNVIIGTKYKNNISGNLVIKKDGILTKDVVDNPKEESFEDLAKKLMKYLSENHSPHARVIISSIDAEIVEGIKGFKTDEFLD